MKKMSGVFGFVMAMLLCGVVTTRAEDKPLTADQQILAGLAMQTTALNVEQESVNTKVSELVKTKARLTSRAEEGRKGFALHEQMARDMQARATAVAARVAQHNVGAGVPAASEAEANAFNSESNALNSEREAIIQEAQRLDTLGKGLNEGREQINKEVLAWTQSVKDTQARQATLDQKRKALEARTLSVLEDLRRRHKMSKGCEGSPSLVRAHQCLQEVWDGAK